MADSWDAFPAVGQSPGPQQQPSLPTSGGGWDAFPVADQAPPERPSLGFGATLADIARSAKSGLGEGVLGLAGLGGVAASLGTQASDYLFGTNAAPTGQAINEAIGPAAIQRGVESYTGPFYKSQTGYGDVARTLASFLPAAAGGPEGIAARLATRVAAPALASEGLGQLTKGTEAEPWARAGGALLGAGIPSAARRAATPFAIPAERQAALTTLANEGVTVPASLATGSKALKVAESELGGSQYGSAIERMGEDFSAASLRRANIPNETRATPPVINATEDRIGNAFDTVAARNSSIPVAGFDKVAGAIAGDYQRLTGSESPLLNDIRARITPTISGDVYQTVSSDIARNARASSNPELKLALYDMKGALDKAVESGLKDPRDAAIWSQARRDWKNLQVIQRAVSGSSEAAANGIITPAALTRAIESMKRGSYAKGQGDFADLARAGNQIMKGYQDSGTASRLVAQAKPAAIGAALGGVISSGGATLLPTLAAIASPYVAGKVLMSRPVQRYLANQKYVAPAGGLRRNLGAVAVPGLVQGQRP